MEVVHMNDNIIAARNIKTVYRENDRAIKVFNEGYLKSDILNEALNQSRVEESGLNVPKLLEVTKIDNKWAIVSEFIDGKTLEQLMNENPDKMDYYLDKFVDIQLCVQSKKAPLLNKLKDKMNRKISEADIDATIRYELHTRLESMPKHTKICHGDFCPSNIICGNDGKDYIIDWSHATQGNASADAARTYLLFCLDGRQDLANQYLVLFCSKSDTARQYVEKWLPIVAASQSVKGKTEERDFLMKWVDVVDYD
jgi:tRNA A-37 threonylcarbamoyl transferase component Bud32